MEHEQTRHSDPQSGFQSGFQSGARSRSQSDSQGNLQRGFTLVEIMVVIVILGLLATLVVPNVLGASDEANLKKAVADVSSLKSTVDIFLIQSGSRELPTWEMLITPDERGRVWLEGYSEPPRDPYGNEYELRPGDRGRQFEIICWGPDGLSETEDDISSLTIKDGR